MPANDVLFSIFNTTYRCKRFDFRYDMCVEQVAHAGRVQESCALERWFDTVSELITHILNGDNLLHRIELHPGTKYDRIDDEHCADDYVELEGGDRLQEVVG